VLIYNNYHSVVQDLANSIIREMEEIKLSLFRVDMNICAENPKELTSATTKLMWTAYVLDNMGRDRCLLLWSSVPNP
jgi:hypothetical protein